MQIEKNAEKRETVFITPTPENSTKVVIFYSSFLPFLHKPTAVKKIENNIRQSGFDAEIVDGNKIKFVRGKAIKDIVVSFNGTAYRGEKEINDFYDTHAVLEVYKDIPQVFMDRIKKYLSDRGLRIVIVHADVAMPTLHYKGNIEKITTSVIEEAERHGKGEIERMLR